MTGTDIWDWCERLWPTDRTSLGGFEQGLAAICDFRQELNAEGLHSYFWHWGGDTAPEALASLADLLGANWATVLREAVALFGDTYPASPNERQDVMSERGHFKTGLDDLNRRFFELEWTSDADALLTTALNPNR